MNKKVKSLDDLEIGIKQLLEGRCSFSEEEKALLNECIAIVQRNKETISNKDILKVFEILLQLFLVAQHLNALF